jgi:hypothetical protein
VRLAVFSVLRFVFFSASSLIFFVLVRFSSLLPFLNMHEARAKPYNTLYREEDLSRERNEDALRE